ncbi:MAG TPA: hypothetical protein VG820_12905, partial [Fimbriimonadaceae bacterium]|nr:hypothetical protein [Fimbriimonadaceae bacterium]
VSVDWASVPAKTRSAEVTIAGSDGTQVVVTVPIRTASVAVQGFVETDGYVSIEAPHFTRKTGKWMSLPGLGRTLGGMTAYPLSPDACLEYRAYFFSSGDFQVTAYLSPTQLFSLLRYALSVDDGPRQTVDMHEGYVYFTPSWEKSVADAAIIRKSRLAFGGPGYHTIKFWAVDPGVVLQKLVVDTGGLRWSYLGPPESRAELRHDLLSRTALPSSSPAARSRRTR